MPAMSRDELIRRLRNFGFRFEQGDVAWSGRLYREGSPPLAAIMLGEEAIRWYLRKDQEGKNAVIAYGADAYVYLLPHDGLLALCRKRGIVVGTRSWLEPPHHYHRTIAPAWMLAAIVPYRLGR